MNLYAKNNVELGSELRVRIGYNMLVNGIAHIAQLVEHFIHIEGVSGSSPDVCTLRYNKLCLLQPFSHITMKAE